ncbi:MAG: carbohydrate-binding domain-containing protein, partial [Clostridia bacterium]|nr:carbohydrate-binding domain-containing protein [Clostridia bacterium]
ITAKKGTQSYLYDLRGAVGEDESAGAIHSETDLELCGKGSLSVISSNHNGVHGKDDLQVKNLSLYVHCADNALKGNDSVELTNCQATLIATAGDGIKTSASDVSDKGNQRGDITVSGACVTVYAACDGMDAAHDVLIDGETTAVSIYTDRYSAYTAQQEVRGGPGGGFGGGGRPGGPGGGFGGGPGGMQEGNPDKGETSTKGIKAANAVCIQNGTVTVKAYDDAIHANNDTALENGRAARGDVTVSGGSVTLYSNDDGMHADGALCIEGGTVRVVNSYEGLEGSTVSLFAGSVSVVSSDDGINSTGTSGEGVRMAGGTLFVNAGGDGIDSNSRDSYKGIVFAGGNALLISTSGGNSAIDTERGYAYEGGNVLALMPMGGMTGEATHCADFSSVATQKSVSVSGVLCVKSNGETVLEYASQNKFSGIAIFLGDNDAAITTQNSAEGTLDENGVCWN